MLYRVFFLVSISFILSSYLFAQTPAPVTQDNNMGTGGVAGDTLLTLKDCLKYALRNQPALNQSLIDQAIARSNNVIAFSSWMPQVTGAANYEHYFQLPVAFSTINGTLTPVTSGVYNYSTPSLTANETLFSPDVLFAVKAARLNILGARQGTESAKIDLVANVSKAFYDLLLSIEQVQVYREDTARLAKNLSDAYNRFVSGIVDKVDYKQAAIALNNSKAQLKQATEEIQAKYAVMKQLMGFPAERVFTVKFDTAQMMQEVFVDTLVRLDVGKRIEYMQLQTEKRIMHENTMYYQFGFLPALSAFYNYNYEFENDRFTDLYNKAYPNSLWGVQLSIPIFTGLRRTENVHKAKLQEQRVDWDEVNLKLAIYTQYKQALANYKSNMYNLREQGDNVNMAREVYNIVKLQYREGVKPYLDVIVAESDLRTSEVNYLNALFQLLESKIDLERAMGDIPTEI